MPLHHPPHPLRRALLVLSALTTVGAATAAEVDVATAPHLAERTYWFGNSFAGGKSGEARWMMQGVDDLAVAGDRVYPIVGWDERGGETNVYSTDGAHVATPEGWHSWGWRGGAAVAVDDTYVYYAMGHDPGDGGGEDFAGIARYTRAGKPAPFAGGKSGHRLAVNGHHVQMPSGVAVQGGELFVADPAAGRIVVYATADLHQVREFPCAHAGRIAIDATPEHALWVIDGEAHAVRRIGRDGRDLGTHIADCLHPVALAVTPEGDLLVADGDPARQRIQRYRVPSGERVAAADFGGPIYLGATPGAVLPGRFFRITSLACGADGSLYVGCWDYGGKIWKFDAQRRLVWVRQGTEFVSCGDADPGADGNVYSSGHRYAIDYTKPPGAGWSDAAITLDPLRWPEDPRLRVDAFLAMRVLRLGGTKVLFAKQQMDAAIFAWRFAGEIAVPAAMYAPNGVQDHAGKAIWPPHHPQGPFLWVDRNGDGLMQAEEYVAAPAGSQAVRLDERGDIVVNTGGWDAGKGAITIIPCTGVDHAGVPQWDVAKARSTPIPTVGGLRQLSKLNYDPVGDRMYIGAWTDEHPFPGGGWEQMSCGAELLRFDHWSSTPHLAWRSVLLPPEGEVSTSPKAWSFEEDYAFVASTWQSEAIAVDVYRLADGKRIGRLLPTADVGCTTGWLDMNDGVQTHKRADGTYLIFAEEVWMAKGLFWQWKPGQR